jgi:DNA-binding response OmpR family regulator
LGREKRNFVSVEGQGIEAANNTPNLEPVRLSAIYKESAIDALRAGSRILPKVRQGVLASMPALSFADVVLETEAWRAKRRGQPLRLTPSEFRLLATFMRDPECVLTWQELSAAIWGAAMPEDRLAVASHVKNLRRKLEAHGPRLIHNVWGVGFILRLPEEGQ